MNVIACCGGGAEIPSQLDHTNCAPADRPVKLDSSRPSGMNPTGRGSSQLPMQDLPSSRTHTNYAVAHLNKALITLIALLNPNSPPNPTIPLSPSLMRKAAAHPTPTLPSRSRRRQSSSAASPSPQLLHPSLACHQPPLP
jgi:hypothetical protein